MKAKSKAGALAIVVAVGALAYYGIAHSKMQAVTGYHILNSDQFSYTTNAQGCAGYALPAEVVPNMNVDKAPAITADKTAGSNCSTTYTSAPTDGSQAKTCLVEIQSFTGGMSLTGTGNCKTSSGGKAIILGAS
jgi:hypothetical protein